jgi:hypothetical protein
VFVAELELTLLDENILDLVLPWFDDDKTRIALGDRDWVRQALQLMETQPGTSEGNLTVNDRVVWVAFESGAAVGLIDVETYSDGSAGLAGHASLWSRRGATDDEDRASSGVRDRRQRPDQGVCGAGGI